MIRAAVETATAVKVGSSSLVKAAAGKQALHLALYSSNPNPSSSPKPNPNLILTSTLNLALILRSRPRGGRTRRSKTLSRRGSGPRRCYRPTTLSPILRPTLRPTLRISPPAARLRLRRAVSGRR